MTETTTEDDAAAQRESIADLCGELVEDAKQLGRAELARMRAIIFRGVAKARMAVFFAVASALLAQSGSLLLLVGLLIYLRRYVGILGATAIVMAVAIAASALFGWLAFRRIKAVLDTEEELL